MTLPIAELLLRSWLSSDRHPAPRCRWHDRPLLRAVLLVALLGCGGPSVNELIDDLSHPDRLVRQRASTELVLLGAPAVEPLMACAAGSDSLRYISAQILGRIGDTRAVPVLQRLAVGDNRYVRREAILALGKMGLPALGAELVVALREDASDAARSAAATSLGNLRDTVAVAALVRALGDPAPVVRQQVVAALHLLWTAEARAAVTSSMQDPDETVRFIAAQSLGAHRVLPALEPLRAALRDTSVWVRAEAARALGKLGDDRAVDDLVRVMKQHDGPDHRAARQALQALTGMDYVVVE